MDQKVTPKSIAVAAVLFSLVSFVYVNWHAQSVLTVSTVKQELPEARIEEDEAEQNELQTPDITLIGRAFEVVRHLLPALSH